MSLCVKLLCKRMKYIYIALHFIDIDFCGLCLKVHETYVGFEQLMSIFLYAEFPFRSSSHPSEVPRESVISERFEICLSF